jgi:hypothetical protein
MNCIENVTTIIRSKLLRRCDRLSLVLRALSVVMYIIVVIKRSRPSAAAHIDLFIPTVPHVYGNGRFIIMPSAGRRYSCIKND